MDWTEGICHEPDDPKPKPHPFTSSGPGALACTICGEAMNHSTHSTGWDTEEDKKGWIALSPVERRHLLTLLQNAAEEGSYYGNREQYWKRHNRITDKLRDG